MERKERPKIGLALGSGGARGFAHIGVLKVFEEENIPIDYIAGSSMGSLIGTVYGTGTAAENMEKFATMFRRRFYTDYIVPKMGFVAGKKVKELIRLLTKGQNLEDLNPKVYVVATDLLKGERVIFKEGSIADAVRASISIPGIFVPEKINGRLLVDGGVIDRVPVSVVKDMGADITIAVDVSYFNVEPSIKTIYDVILQSLDIMEKEMMKYRHINTDVLIRPMTKAVSSVNFTNIDKLIKLGENETRRQLPLIKSVIQNWKEQNDGNQ
ncbi:MAG: patatin family protein, partial [Bacteroidetes bacterium]|nr:patatin family protein [Bacteroidota bacterium]